MFRCGKVSVPGQFPLVHEVQDFWTVNGLYCFTCAPCDPLEGVFNVYNLACQVLNLRRASKVPNLRRASKALATLHPV